MAQIKFYFSSDEWERLFNYILFTGSNLVPDIVYDSEQYNLITSFSDFIYYQKNETTHFFLINDKFTEYPLSICQNKYTDDLKYNILQRRAGPYIDISYYRGFSDDAAIPYAASYLDYYPNFIYPDNSYEFKAPDSLKEYYGSLVKIIKKSSQLVSKNGVRHWLGGEAYSKINTL
ncbi:MAG: hypothetical protein JST19_16695 [Bacteroidetes bacterium]|nr:hypothetical protein [Bacteroidota bacterium]